MGLPKEHIRDGKYDFVAATMEALEKLNRLQIPADEFVEDIALKAKKLYKDLGIDKNILLTEEQSKPILETIIPEVLKKGCGRISIEEVIDISMRLVTALCFYVALESRGEHYDNFHDFLNAYKLP